MKITKYEHACLVVEEGTERLIIDPGSFTKSLNDFPNVVGVVVTHVHQDHLDPELIKKIVAANPNTKIFTTQEGAQALVGLKTEVVSGGDSKAAGSFKLDFYGGAHALIHSSIPQNQNVGVMVNDRLYYPGDSFDPPTKPTEVLAIPAAAPWMKTGEAMDFLAAVKPKIAFPTHDSVSSEAGAGFTNRLIGGIAENIGCQYKVLKSGESLEVPN